MKFALLFALTLSTALHAADQAFSMPGLKQDIEFAKAGEVSLTLDAFAPEGPGPFATCILVHGGGFTKGDKHSFIKPLFEPLSKAGFTWFTINYRLAPQHQWPACADDVSSAIKWVKAHAAEYKVQVQRRKALGGLGGLIGTEDVNDAAWQRLAEISPINHIQAGLPPFLQIHGDKDETVPISQSVNFEAKTKAAGNSCETITIPGGGHGMGGWDKLGSDYQTQLIAWLRKTLK